MLLYSQDLVKELILRRFAFWLAIGLIPAAHGAVITFDDLPLSSGGAEIPAGYAA